VRKREKERKRERNREREKARARLCARERVSDEASEREDMVGTERD
jgi:hypothetical protein